MLKKLWSKLWLALRSRTVWSIIALFVVSGVDGVRDLLPGTWLPAVQSLLGFLTVYFRVNPRVKE